MELVTLVITIINSLLIGTIFMKIKAINGLKAKQLLEQTIKEYTEFQTNLVALKGIVSDALKAGLSIESVYNTLKTGGAIEDCTLQEFKEMLDIQDTRLPSRKQSTDLVIEIRILVDNAFLAVKRYRGQRDLYEVFKDSLETSGIKLDIIYDRMSQPRSLIYMYKDEAVYASDIRRGFKQFARRGIIVPAPQKEAA